MGDLFVSNVGLVGVNFLGLILPLVFCVFLGLSCGHWYLSPFGILSRLILWPQLGDVVLVFLLLLIACFIFTDIFAATSPIFGIVLFFYSFCCPSSYLPCCVPVTGGPDIIPSLSLCIDQNVDSIRTGGMSLPVAHFWQDFCPCLLLDSHGPPDASIYL